MERSDWLIQKLEGWSKPPPPPKKSGTGIVWADKRRCDWSDKNDVIDAGIYSGLRLFFKKWMETDKYVTLTSERIIIATLRTLRSDNGDGDGNLRSLGRGSLCDVGVSAKIEITTLWARTRTPWRALSLFYMLARGS